VFSVYDEARGLDDESIVQKAHLENYILITADKDLAEIIFRRKKPHKGIILLRLEDEKPASQIAVLRQILESYSNRLANNFVVATEKTVRIVETKKTE
jgi:predicted nuclease of predicted toxin-antitoxin system